MLHRYPLRRLCTSRIRMGKHPPFKGMGLVSSSADAPDVESSRADFDKSYEPNTTKVPEPNFVPGQGLNNLVRSWFGSRI